MPSLDDSCSRYFTYRDLIQCGKTWHAAQAAGAPIDNAPKASETWAGLARLASTILDPVVERFGRPELTYGFAGPSLARAVGRRIAPELDQHAGCERSRTGRLVCPRGGQAVDFAVAGVPSDTLGAWIASTLPFDKIYFYGADRPIHVSACQSTERMIVLMMERDGRRVPRRVSIEQFVAMADRA